LIPVGLRIHEGHLWNVPTHHPPPLAILLHGLGRSPWSMRLIQRALVDQGYRVVNLGYPSRAADIATLATNVGRQIATLDGEA